MTPRIMLHKVFEQVVIDESDDSQLISLMGLQSADTEGEEFRRWIIGIHTEREIEEVDLDTQLAPGDTVVLYYLRGSDFLEGGKPEEPSAPVIDDDVGIIPNDWKDCPKRKRVTIFMDDEDSDNQNASGGWTGSIQSGRNTTFRLCKVDGGEFRPLKTRGTPRDATYAVVKLDTYCPKGSTEFYRYFDNEDSNNKNQVSASPDEYLPMMSNRQGTRLVFCLFVGEENGMEEFPEVGFPYGVFASPHLGERFAMKRGWVLTDDEDSDNRNEFRVANRRVEKFASEIVEEAPSRSSKGGNTRLNLARVK